MANRRYEETKKLLKDHGYASQTELARALVNTETYKDREIKSVKSHVNQVLNGKINLSKNLETALLELSPNNEGIIDKLRTIFSPDKKLEFVLESKFDRIYRSFRESFLDLDWKDKSDVCVDFENFVEGYFTKKEEK